jgi:hypothetical protein
VDKVKSKSIAAGRRSHGAQRSPFGIGKPHLSLG